jgi:hypothetical protein
MKRIWFLSIVFLVFSQTACHGQPSKANRQMIRPDSTVVSIWGDSICDILFSPTKVNGYIVKVMETASPKTETVGGFAVEKKLGRIEKADYAILQFLLQDSLSYRNDGGMSKCPFHPYLAFEFIRKKEKVVLLLAFNCRGWGVVYNDKLQTTEYVCENQLLRFAVGILPDDSYLNVLLKK